MFSSFLNILIILYICIKKIYLQIVFYKYNTMASYQFNPINILDNSNATSLTDDGSMTLAGGISIMKCHNNKFSSDEY
jgi:hypothetical protein